MCDDSEDRANARENAAIERGVAAQGRDDAAHLREDARRKELRQDIQNTQHLVADSGEDVIFRVDGLQDKFFAHLISATNAIEGATEALAAEKRTRRIQIAVLAGAVLLGIFVGIFTLINSMQIRAGAEESQEATCEAINDNHDTILFVLERLASRTGIVSPEYETLLEEFREDRLRHLDC